MSLLGWLRRRLVEIVEWPSQARDLVVWRFPDDDRALRNGARLVVREGQMAVLVHEGQLADVFPPGLYTLSTQNVPGLAGLAGWRHGFSSPFKCEVSFVSTLEHAPLRWGTPQPLATPGGGALRAFGSAAARVDPDGIQPFFRTFAGAAEGLSWADLEQHLRPLLLSAIVGALGDPGGTDPERLAERAEPRAADALRGYGLILTQFAVESAAHSQGGTA